MSLGGSQAMDGFAARVDNRCQLDAQAAQHPLGVVPRQGGLMHLERSFGRKAREKNSRLDLGAGHGKMDDGVQQPHLGGMALQRQGRAAALGAALSTNGTLTRLDLDSEQRVVAWRGPVPAAKLVNGVVAGCREPRVASTA